MTTDPACDLLPDPVRSAAYCFAATSRLHPGWWSWFEQLDADIADRAFLLEALHSAPTEFLRGYLYGKLMTRIAVSHPVKGVLADPGRTATSLQRYASFTLDVLRLNYQPVDTQLVSQGLQSGKQLTYGQAAIVEETRPEDYIVRELINFDDISYDDHADLIYELAGQAVAHFKSYLADEAALDNVLGNYAKPIADIIHAQMAKHYVEESVGSEVVISQGFVPLKNCAFTARDDIKPLHWTPDDKRTIGQFVYGGFQRCA